MSKGSTILSGLFWRFAERMGAQIVTFVVSIVLARILAPSDYGMISLVTIFVTIANVLVTSGFGNSLIQKKDADDLDFSSVFFAQLGLAILLYVVLFFAAPYIAAFFGDGYENLCQVLRVIGLRIPIAAINNVQHAYVSRKMIFKKFFIATIFGTIASAAVGLWMAYAGYGVWALVGQYLTNVVMDTIILGLTVAWRPRLLFSFARLKPLFSFGWKLLTVDLVNSLLNNLRTVLVGKVYSSSDLAYYDKGEQFPSLIVTNINSSVQSVLFPAMSKEQDEPEKVKELLRTMIRVGSFVIFPLTFGLMAVAKPVILLLLTEKWIETVPYVQIFCASYSLRILSTSCAQSVKAMGRSDLYMKNTLIYKAIELCSIVISAIISVKAVAVGTLINAMILVFIQYNCNRKLTQYRIGEFLTDLLPCLLLSSSMVAVVAFMGMFSSSIIMVVFQILVGGIWYIGGAYLFRMKAMGTILNIIKGFFHKT